VHLYKIFSSACRYIALTASVKFRIGSPKTAQNEQVCAHQKVIQEVNFPKSFLNSFIQDGLWLCTYIAVFLYGVKCIDLD